MHTLLHIYGPFAIHSYGFMIALGLLLFMFLTRRDPRYTTLKLDAHFSMIIAVGIIAAILGGRLLFFASYPDQIESVMQFFAFHEGGFSILGAISAVVIALPFYLKTIGVPIIPLLDLFAIYGPLLQSISRIGCFLAGCCYGLPTAQPWGIIYTDATTVAPLNVCMHPTQLYSAALLMLIFAFQYFIGRSIFKHTGQLLSSYLFLVAAERFIVDFWRGDRMVDVLHISINQYVALAIMAAACIGFLASRMARKL